MSNTGPVVENLCGPRVLRGGGWVSGAGGCRSACRRWSVPGLPLDSWGFRPVADVQPRGGDPQQNALTVARKVISE